MMFQGTEIASNQNWVCCSNMPFYDINSLVGIFSYDQQCNLVWTTIGPYQGFFKFTSDVLKIKNLLSGFSGSGYDLFHVNNNNKVIAFTRWLTSGTEVIVIANFGGTAFPNYDIGLPNGGTWYVVFNGDLKTYSTDFGDTGKDRTTVTAIQPGGDNKPYKGTISIGAYSLLVISRNQLPVVTNNCYRDSTTVGGLDYPIADANFTAQDFTFAISGSHQSIPWTEIIILLSVITNAFL